MAFLLILGTIILALLCYPVLSGVFQICQHYVEARKIGLPILIAPFGPMSVIWMLSDSFVTPLIKFLDAWCPIPIFSWIEYTAFGWQFQSRHAIHLKHGPAFLIVSPGETQLHVADVCFPHLRCIPSFQVG
jgi:hypothetical protein